MDKQVNAKRMMYKVTVASNIFLWWENVSDAFGICEYGNANDVAEG